MLRVRSFISSKFLETGNSFRKALLSPFPTNKSLPRCYSYQVQNSHFRKEGVGNRERGLCDLFAFSKPTLIVSAALTLIIWFSFPVLHCGTAGK